MVLKILAAMGRKGVYEEIPLLLLVRMILWFVMLLIPIALLLAFAFDRLNVEVALLGAAAFAVLVTIAARWRTTIIFSVPGEPLIQASEILNAVAPQSMRPSEVLKMSVEDNVGDPRPAAQVFGYEPETFEEGLGRVLRPN